MAIIDPTTQSPNPNHNHNLNNAHPNPNFNPNGSGNMNMNGNGNSSGNPETDLMQLWAVITELGEQLSQNRSLSVSLYSQAGKIKHHAINSQTGFVLRRFNMDKTKEEYDAELEHMSTVMSQENQSLQNDNKQLNALIKEYEQTLETLMSSFRNRAQDVQERELSLIRHYEHKLLSLDTTNAQNELTASTAASGALIRISNLLRDILRAEGGENVEEGAIYSSLSAIKGKGKAKASDESGEGHEEADETQDEAADQLQQLQQRLQLLQQQEDEEDEDREPWRRRQDAEWSLEREIELVKRERENEELRRLAGLLPAAGPLAGVQRSGGGSSNGSNSGMGIGGNGNGHGHNEGNGGDGYRPTFELPNAVRLPTTMQMQMQMQMR